MSSEQFGAADEDASLGNEEEGASNATGGAGSGGGRGALDLLSPVPPAHFVAGARALAAGTAGSLIFVIDAAASSAQVLRAFDPAGASTGFDIPVAAVETVTPLGIHGGTPKWVLAAVSFGRGFESLGAVFGKLGGAPRVAEAFTAESLDAETAGEGGDDDDPAAPHAAEISEVADLATARVLANVGTGIGVAEAFDLEGPRPEAEAAAPPTMALDVARAHAFLAACTGSSPRVTYGLGAKVPFLGAVPGKDFKKVDCSGFVREAIRLATHPRVAFPDGSVVQHEFVRAKGFRKSNVEAALKTDGAVRVAFLRPQDAKSGIGHVVLIHNARTLESHGGTGPNSRPWNGSGWQAKAFVYRLTDPI